MKKIAVIFAGFLGLMSVLPIYAQKFGYVDADFILKKMVSYEKAQANIQESSAKWEADIDKKFAAVEEMEKKYLAEEILLTEEMKTERKAEIKKFKDEAREYQKKVFGYQGLFFTRQKELLKPTLEELHKAIENVARKHKLQFVFSNTEGLTMLYAEQRHDYTEEVLEALGIKKPDEKPEDQPNNNPAGNSVKSTNGKKN
jgi:outer membrane protein